MNALDRLFTAEAGPLSLRELVVAGPLRILVLAPHPDDFDAIALSLRHLHRQGHELHVAVLTSGASGVDPGFGGAGDHAARARLREAEQRASCSFFGLAPQRLQFLRLWESGAGGAPAPGDPGSGSPGDPTDDAAADTERLRSWLQARPADLLFMPHGNDSNATHRRTCETVCALAIEEDLQAWACLNQDAKTLAMRVDLYYAFGAQEAAWKKELLRLHASQQARNLRARGSGFDERVLQVNRAAAARLGTPEAHAEVFELHRLGRPGGRP